MIKMYGSYLWPDCDAPKEALSKKGIEYEYIDITKSMKNLKDFLKIRDNSEKFDIIKATNHIGLPCIDNDGKIYLQNEIKELIEIL